MKYLSANISFLQKEKKLTTKALAKHAGIKETSLQQIIKNPESATIETLVLLAGFFEISLDRFLSSNLANHPIKSSNIKLLVLDVDGVLTDGGMYYTEGGEEFKKFNSKDGLAIKRLVKKGVHVAFLSNGKNVNLIQSRADLLGVKLVYVGNKEKEIILNKWLKELKLTYKNVAYIGDDLNDLHVMQKSAISACPVDANDSILKAANIILSRKGGDACVREMIDKYL